MTTPPTGQVFVTDCDFGDSTIERAILRPGFEVIRVDSRDPSVIAQTASNAVGLFVQWAQIDAVLLDSMPLLRGIVRYGVGLDSIDLAACEARNIRVRNVDDYCIDEVADHTVAAIYSDNRRLSEADAAVKRQGWPVKGWRIQPPSNEPVGVLGMGRIGQAVTSRLRSLGFPVHYYDPGLPANIAAGVDGTRHESVIDVASACTHLTVHLPLTNSTRGLIDSEVINALGPTGHLVNAGRGGLVDEEHLLEALEAASLRRASLDVFVTEPPKGVSALLARHPRVTATPHIAYLSDRSLERLQVRAGERMLEILQ